MKKVLVLSLLMASVAFAGKAERDAVTEVQPKVASAIAAIKKNCGNTVKASINWDSFKTVESIYSVSHLFEKIESGVADYCKDAGSKKAMAVWKEIDVKPAPAGKDAELNFAGGKVATTVTNDSSFGWEAIAKKIDQ
jgi:hypothetical protein